MVERVAKSPKNLFSIRDFLNLIKRNGIVTAVVQTGCAGGFVSSHLLGDFQLAAV